jgi:hypothetical protein
MMMEKADPACKRRFLRFVALVLMLSLEMAAAASFGLRKDGRLDIPALRNAYHESDFEKVSAILEGYLKRNAPEATREERIFAYKYLGVIHAHMGFMHADDRASQARAESYFNQLVEMAPNIELVDMYVPSNIQQLFDRIKREFRSKQEYRRQFDEFGNPIPRPSDTAVQQASGKNPRESAKVAAAPSRTWMYWTMGVVAVGAGVGFYIWQETRTRTEQIDVTP